jgi:hypothetical protein
VKRIVRFYTLSAILLAGICILVPNSVEGTFLMDYLIWDPDPNHNSGPNMDAALRELGFCGDYAPVSANDLMNNYTPFTDYASIFICLGTYPENYIFGNQNGDFEVDTLLVNYLMYTNPPDTPHIYMEGGDTWAFDPWMTIHPWFQIDSTCSEDGYNDLYNIIGISNTCTDGLEFPYVGETNYNDRLCKLDAGSPPDTTVYIFENGPDSAYYCSVGYKESDRQYISIASSFEFGGIDSLFQTDVMDSIMCFFEIDSGCVVVRVEESIGDISVPDIFTLNQSAPNPSGRIAEIRFGLPQDSHVNLSIYDVTGRLITVLANESIKAGYHTVTWEGRDRMGNFAGNGVYFYRLRAKDYIATKKIVILK